MTADAGSALIDGVPGRRTRLRWMTATGQVLTDHVVLKFTLPGPTAVNAAALLNTSLPTGVKVNIELWNGGATLGSGSVRTARLGDGNVGAVWRPTRQTTVTEVRVVIYNDVNGSVGIPAGTLFDLGEVIFGDLVDMPHVDEWDNELVDPSSASRTRGSRPIVASKTPYRRFESALTPQTKAIARQGGLTNGQDWETLRRAMLPESARTIAIVRHNTPAGAVDQPEIEDTLLFGIGRMAAISHRGGDWYGTTVTVEEIP
ncbi:hypothetical protein V3390_00080 [Luteimonas sp. FXH3W]|uniref:Minor tail protein n=1 Tax=Aquilutibacter rugosus TaxID=3115820 RepID=A0ABU7UVT9_9GAMM